MNVGDLASVGLERLGFDVKCLSDLIHAVRLHAPLPREASSYLYVGAMGIALDTRVQVERRPALLYL